MRSQGCTIQQALTPEAATVVKQAVALAKRRGHAQVTPLHVAHTMLAAPSGLLRAACLQSHSHPLQCRALELCFNVALNRLPTSTSGPILGPHTSHHHPTIANALVAAFKRAQAHQRRGSIENQQQPLLAVKIELEQLIISILDDPSVSRVMREAGFSSTLVKGKVEQAVSMEAPSNNNNNNNNSDNKIKDTNNNNHLTNNTNNNSISIITTTNNNNNNNFLCMSQIGSLKVGKPRLCEEGEVRDEDMMIVIESLVNKRKRNSVVVGECLTSLESLVRGVMDKVEKGEVPEILKEVKFIHLSFSCFGHLSRDDVEQRIAELKCLVKTCCMGENKGVILYLDDLKWVNEFRASNINILVDQQQARRSYYCPIEHMIMEIGKMVLCYGSDHYNGKMWLLGIATFQTYMRCRSGQSSSLETLWGLHAITIPAGSLGLSLVPESDSQSPLTCKKVDTNRGSWLMLESSGVGGGGGAVNMEVESRQGSTCNSDSTNSSLPSWLQQHKDENSKRESSISNNDQESLPVKDLCKRWGSICTTSSPSFERALSFSSISPSSFTSNFSYDPHHSKQQITHQSFEPKNFWVTHETLNKTHELTTFTMSMSSSPLQDQRKQATSSPFISSNPNSTPTSTSSSEIMDPLESKCLRFKDYDAENLKALCDALELEVPHQKDIILDIASTILHCRARKSKRKGNEQGNKEDTWLFFQGNDIESKEKIARELARLVFGSQDKFISLGLSSFSSTRGVTDNSLEDSRNKRLRDEQSCSYIERFAEVVSRDSHRVFFVEDIEQVDYCSQMGIKKAIERGKISKHSSGEEVSFGDAIIILSCEKFSSRSRACSPSTKHKVDIMPQEDNHKGDNNGDDLSTSPSISLDLNLSINDDDEKENNEVGSQSMDEIGLLASVDKCIVFKKKREF
ncbi:protein SMAX1-LIKE 3-like isoform X1 [Amaranthus tricolor]|uniref:protein SMAX1-LIKE 3-like isoform X1 n=1 Tax=Amaranthus tricolor TaxID=29722 RepID=UPI002590D73D|nr:protein SMAX1-LIKE 3-like isoform X1 [Amaranthus tricolor]